MAGPATSVSNIIADFTGLRPLFKMNKKELDKLAGLSPSTKQAVSQREIASTHSALVELTLAVGGRIFQIQQMGPDFLFIDEVGSVEPGAVAEINLRIDGVDRKWGVRLPDGMRTGEYRVKIAAIK